MTKQDKCVIIGHTGFADFFSQNALYWHYINQYPKGNTTIIVGSQSRKPVVEGMLRGSGVRVVVAKTVGFKDRDPIIRICFLCDTPGGPNKCPRPPKREACKFVNTNVPEFENADYVGLGVWCPDIHNQFRVYHKKSKSYAHAFYEHLGFNPDMRFQQFHLNRDHTEEQKKYEELVSRIGSQYVVIHEDTRRGFKINRRRITNKQLPIFDLNQKSKNMVDMLTIIDKAQEIHVLDSNYSVLIHLMQLSDNTFAPNTKIFLHASSRNRGRDISIYTPKIKHWIVV